MSDQYFIYLICGLLSGAISVFLLLHFYNRKKIAKLMAGHVSKIATIETKNAQLQNALTEQNAEYVAAATEIENCKAIIAELNKAINDCEYKHARSNEELRLISESSSAKLIPQLEKLANAATGLKDVTLAFERWHKDMSSLMTQNRDMQTKNQEFASIVKQVILLSINAAIEATRAGQAGHGFAVVANEIKVLAVRSETLSKSYRKNLHKNDLLTAMTFQDIQAGGKLMMAAISTLESLIDHFRSTVDARYDNSAS